MVSMLEVLRDDIWVKLIGSFVCVFLFVFFHFFTVQSTFFHHLGCQTWTQNAQISMIFQESSMVSVVIQLRSGPFHALQQKEKILKR